MPIDYQALLLQIKDSIVTTVRAHGKTFIDSNASVPAFLEERAVRSSTLIANRAFEADVIMREQIDVDIRVVIQTIENSLSTVAVNASAESRAMFSKILGSAIEALWKAVPAIISAL